MRASLRPGLALAMSMLLPLGCGSPQEETTGGSTSTGGQPDADDGRIHPPGNGVHESETDACDALVAAQQAKYQSLGCAATTRICPDFIRSQFATPCMEYDQGSVQGCIDLYKGQQTCENLAKMVMDCVVTPFPGTEPAGCPK